MGKICRFENPPQWIWGDEHGYIIDNYVELWYKEYFVRAKLHAKCYIDSDGDILETDIIKFEIYEYFDEEGAIMFPNMELKEEIYNALFDFLIDDVL
jgi:hypothetical protein